MRPTYKAAILAVMLLLPFNVGAFATPALNANSKLETQNSKLIEGVRAGFGDTGAYIIGEWVPVRVTLANPSGGADRRARVEINSVANNTFEVLGTYSHEVDLPAQSRKVVTLFAYTTSFIRELEVRVLDGLSGANRVVESAQARLEPYQGRANVLVGVVSSDPSLLNALNGELVGHPEDPPDPAYGSSSPQPASPGRAQVVHITSADIPEVSQGLESLGVLVLDDLSPSAITEEQRQAIEAWVARGGMLIASGRPSGVSALAGIADLLPVTLGPPQQIDNLSSLGNLVATPLDVQGSLQGQGGVLVSGASLKADPNVPVRSLASNGGNQLAAVRELGGGHVVYLAPSPAAPPLQGWAGTLPLMKRLMAEHPVRTSANAASRAGSQGNLLYTNFGGGLFDLPGLELPSPLLVAVFLLVYIVLVGPVNFLVLRRMRKQEWAWATVPALVLVFSVGAYLIGYGAKGGESVVLRADLVTTSPGTREGSTTQFVGLFSPSRGTYDLALDSPVVVSELATYGYSQGPSNPVRVMSGDGTRIEDVTVNTWTLRGFMAEGVTQDGSPLTVELELGNDVIEGRVRNRSATQLDDVALLMGDKVQSLGGLGPGQEKPVSLVVSQGVIGDDVIGRLLPPPPGVTVGNYGPYYDGRALSNEWRSYNRKWVVLGSALQGLVSYAPLTRMEVLAFAWGPQRSDGFRVQGNAREEGVTLWASRAYLMDGDNSRLSMGFVPFSIYAPGNQSSWVAGRQQVMPTLSLNPYADITLRLSPDLESTSVRCTYQLTSALQGKVSVLAYNTEAGTWTPVGELVNAPGGTPTEISLNIPDLGLHIGPWGDLTLRFVAETAGQTLSFSTLEFGMNVVP